MNGHGEFALIRRHFQRARPLQHATLGIGDDCALLAPRPGEQLAISTDMLVAGRHFFEDVAPAALGHKALAVNLSDLAAMGAQPLACTLALALPHADDAWLQQLAHGLFALADAHGCELVGGDTTRGPLNLCLTVFGSVPAAAALRRSGAQAGDDIYASHGQDGGVGDARLALQLLLQQRGAASSLPTMPAAQCSALLAQVRHRLELPQPRVALGLALRGVASACADLSDGLSGDLQHILNASGVGATLYAQDGPAAGLLCSTSLALRSLGASVALDCALAGGDDYELLFTAPVQHRAAVAAAAQQAGLYATRIGQIDAAPGLRWRKPNGQTAPLRSHSFDHFA